MAALWLPFVVLAVVAAGFGWLWTRRADKGAQAVQRELGPKNPLELTTAFLFALLFLVMLVATQLAVKYLGKGGVDTLAAIMGVSDVDPFIMGLTQAAGTLTPVKVAAGAILIAAASNNVVKGIYAYSLARQEDRRAEPDVSCCAGAWRVGSADLAGVVAGGDKRGLPANPVASVLGIPEGAGGFQPPEKRADL